MESSPASEVAHDLHPYFRVYKDGRVERFSEFPYVPPSQDPITGVRSKDVSISPQVSARIFLPKITNPDKKFPLVLYTHGGAFVIESAFSALYHNYVSSLAAEANAIVVSVEYRLAPEHHVPACYDDSWAALKWVSSHAYGRQGPEPWINEHADFTRAFLAGDSAGANIAHNVMVRASIDGGEGLDLDGAKIVGMVLVHPYFGNGKPERVWMHIGPGNDGCEDPRFTPKANPSLLSRLRCCKVLVFTADIDEHRDRGLLYYETLKNSDWRGELEFMESEGEDHCFHLVNPACEKAKILMKRVVSFIN